MKNFAFELKPGPNQDLCRSKPGLKSWNQDKTRMELDQN